MKRIMLTNSIFTQIHKVLWLVGCLGCATLSWAESVQLFEISMVQQTQNQASLTLHLTAPVVHNVFTLTHPDRLVIDLNTTRLKNKAVLHLGNNALLENVRSGPRNDNDLRIVLDLRTAVKFQSVLLRPAGQQNYHLTIVINALNSVAAVTPEIVAVKSAEATHESGLLKTAMTPDRSTTPAAGQPRDFLVVIDAGHGGIDPGAVGQQGTREKDVTLAIARKVEKLLWQDPHIKSLMTRTGDNYLNLRTRADIAREHKADLFISIHADAMPNNDTAKGGSVYMLSPSGASSEAAQWLAQRENASDLVDGTKLSDKDEVLASVLLDLSQNNTLEASAYVGKSVLNALDRVNRNHLDKVQQAAFMVLRSPDVPSVLIETGFLSTPSEESKLISDAYQQQIAQAIFDGIRTYLHDYVLQDTLLATLGDTKIEVKH
jgi:N-acetylmuramoyl-L-alanine amidase